MIPRPWLKSKVRQAAHQIIKYTFTQKVLHNISERLRGPSIVFLRCRRVLPRNVLGENHREAKNPGALFPEQLESLLQEMGAKLPFMYLGEALALLRSGKTLDHSVAVLTFDEAYESSIAAALPVLEKMNIPATFFVCSGHLQPDNALIWDEEVHALVEAIGPSPLSLPWMDRQLQTHPASIAYQTGLDLLKHLLPLSQEKRKQRIDSLRQQAKNTPPNNPLDHHITTDSLKTHAAHPLLTFGAHGHSHAPMLSLPAAQLLEELHMCRTTLREICKESYLDVLSFPFGHQNQLAPELIQRAMEAGFEAAFHADEGVVRPGDHLFALPRLLLSKKTRILEAYELQGLSTALDETLLVLTGAEAARGDYLTG